MLLGKIRNSLLVMLVAFLSLGCFEQDEAVQPFPRGGSVEQVIPLGNFYNSQLFFDLGTNAIVRTNSKMLWDLAFSCDGNQVLRLNSGRNMRAAYSDALNFEDVMDTAGLRFTWDWAHGRADSSALFGWQNHQGIVVINMGYDEENKTLGFVKLKLTVQGENLEVEYAPLGESTSSTLLLQPDEKFNYVHASFLNDEVLQAEPPKTSYDILFTQYIHYFHEEKLAYLVVGALKNPYQTKLTKEFSIPFDSIGVDYLSRISWNEDADAIGYDWKYFNLGEGTYVVLDKQNYLLQDSEGFYYKLHFTGFYDRNGVKGFPTIAFQKI
jgi:hypothetical protein